MRVLSVMRGEAASERARARRASSSPTLNHNSSPVLVREAQDAVAVHAAFLDEALVAVGCSGVCVD